MGGRNPHEAHRVATPLELLFDLTFATSFNLAASQLADALAAGRFMAALLGFSFASFAICWAWINFSWFSSAYDTDDWIFRIVTMTIISKRRSLNTPRKLRFSVMNRLMFLWWSRGNETIQKGKQRNDGTC